MNFRMNVFSGVSNNFKMITSFQLLQIYVWAALSSSWLWLYTHMVIYMCIYIRCISNLFSNRDIDPVIIQCLLGKNDVGLCSNFVYFWNSPAMSISEKDFRPSQYTTETQKGNEQDWQEKLKDSDQLG